jgi:DNA-binding transcriptional LysR family regulator
MHHLDIDGLATVVAIANRASFAAAARERGKTQAAVSFSVARLEERLQTRLFERSPHGVSPTTAGEALVHYARQILALESEAIETVTGKGAGGRVRLGMPDDYLDGLGLAAVDRFCTRWPAVQVDITCDFSLRLETMVARRDLDLAIVTRGDRPADGETLRREAQIWCASADAEPEHLDPLPLALFSDACRARPAILEALTRAERRWRVTTSCSHLHGVVSAVARGRAVTVLPESTVPASLRRLGPESGLPSLPALDIALLLPAEADVTTRRLAETLRTVFGGVSPAPDPAQPLPPRSAMPPWPPRHGRRTDTAGRSRTA